MSNTHDLSDLTPDQDRELALFFEAGQPQMDVPAALSARILADADAVQAAAKTVTRPAPAPERKGWFAALGGWPGFATLSTAMLAGVWIGYSPPVGLDDLALSFSSANDTVTGELFNVMASYDELFVPEG